MGHPVGIQPGRAVRAMSEKGLTGRKVQISRSQPVNAAVASQTRELPSHHHRFPTEVLHEMTMMMLDWLHQILLWCSPSMCHQDLYIRHVRLVPNSTR